MKKYEISEQTARLVNCIQLMEELYKEVHGTLNTIYDNDEATVEDILNDCFAENFLKLKEDVLEFIHMSIERHLDKKDFTEI
jgi:hypothetical protein